MEMGSTGYALGAGGFGTTSTDRKSCSPIVGYEEKRPTAKDYAKPYAPLRQTPSASEPHLTNNMRRSEVPRELRLLLTLTVLVFVGLGVSPKADRFTWLLENLPVLVAVPLLVMTYSRFPLSMLAYRFIFLHSLILMVGGHYTYARVPLGDWFREVFSLSRNHYDRLGHFVQGFVPALLTREILLRRTALARGKMLGFLVISVCLAISAFYELIEWWVALATGSAAEAFLGTQGDVWDTQWDMAFALAGAVTCLVTLSRMHNRQLARINEISPNTFRRSTSLEH